MSSIKQNRELEVDDHKGESKTSLLAGKMVVHEADPSNETLKPDFASGAARRAPKESHECFLLELSRVGSGLNN